MLKKIKKIIIGVGMFLYTLPSRKLAYSDKSIDLNELIREELIQGQPVYGVQEPPIYESAVWKIFQFILLPIILLIGLVIYFKKSKHSKKCKIIISSIITTAIIALIYIVGNILLYKNRVY